MHTNVHSVKLVGPFAARLQAHQLLPKLRKGLHHIFVIGDWGGVIDFFDKNVNPWEVHSPKTADHTSKASVGAILN